MDGCHGSGGLK